MKDPLLEMLGDLPDFPGTRPPKNRSTKQKALRDIDDRFNGAKPKTFRVNGEEKQFFTIGDLAKALRRKPVTIRVWERQGLIPKSTYRTPKPKGSQIPGKPSNGRRLYSREQVEFLMEAVARFGLDTESADWNGFRQHTSKQYPK
jgi:hypothetical protein